MRRSPFPTLVRALLAPEIYPHAPAAVELVETHISWVFLAGDRVYKVKKPVNLGFLDFSTLERRRLFCEEEVRLNRRLAGDVYLGVVELKGSAARPRFGGHGAVVEVAVEMRRLPAERMLDRLARERRAEPRALHEVGVVVARFHAAADTGGEIDELGGLDTVRENWRENFAQTAEVPPDVLHPDVRRAVVEYVTTFLDREAPRFAARVAAGHSRDCHGDLQAQHVCCTEPIRIFDCIEFNHRFRFGDTANEIAFLAMDLDHLGRADLAIRFLNAYLEESGDWEAVPLLDFYRAYRAWVRGKVLGFQLGDRPEVADECRAYFAQAASYVTRPGRASLVVTSGVMGTGKSTVAAALGARTGAIVVRTDVVRKRLGGLALRDRALDAFGEGLYTPVMSRRTYEEALRLAGDVVSAGWPVIVDGSFSHAAERAEARAVAERLGVPFSIVWCEAPDAVVAARLRERARDPHEVSDGRVALLASHRERYESPAGEPDVRRIETDGDVEAALDRAQLAWEAAATRDARGAA